MALVLADRIKESTTVTSTGPATLLGAATGFQAFSVLGNGSTTYYCIADQTGNWEVGLGTYSTTGPTLTRTTILSSSNSGSAVVFGAGTKDVFVTIPAGKGVWTDAAGTTGQVLTTVTTGVAPTWQTPAGGAGGITLASPITGYVVGANTALAATDTVNAAFGKLQGQVSARQAAGTYATGTGTASGTNTGDQTNVSGSSGSCTGNANTATTLIGNQSNWVSYRSSAVANMLGWKHFGNNHIIFDASNSTSPTGSAVNNTNSATAWSATYPTLMGWNGTSTYGVRVDIARISDSTSGSSTTFTSTTQNSQFNSIGVGAAAAATAGDIRATGNITAYWTSDERLKENISPITNALEKVNQINGVNFDWTEEEITARGGIDGYFVRKNDVGVIAQEIEQVLPEAVATRDNGYKAVRYELIVPLLIESIKELSEQNQQLLKRIDELKEMIINTREGLKQYASKPY